MRKIIAVLTWSLIVSISILAQRPQQPDGRISFDIAEAEDNVPLGAVFVYVHNAQAYGLPQRFRQPDEQKDVTVQLDDKGLGDVTLRPGLYHIFISFNGFGPRCRVIAVL